MKFPSFFLFWEKPAFTTLKNSFSSGFGISGFLCVVIFIIAESTFGIGLKHSLDTSKHFSVFPKTSTEIFRIEFFFLSVSLFATSFCTMKIIKSG